MHTPEGETMWSVPDVALADDEEGSDKQVKKEAMGLLDIPTSMGGGDEPDENWDVINFRGNPKNPGLGRGPEGEEETEFFGAKENDVGLPPGNERPDPDDLENANDFIDFLFKSKNAYQVLTNMAKQVLNNGAVMNSELQKLESFLNKSGKSVDAASVSKLLKNAGPAGAAVGAALGFTPGFLMGMPNVGVLLGGTAGYLIEEYFTSNPSAKSALENQKDVVAGLMSSLRGYGVTDKELGDLEDKTILPGDYRFVNHMAKTTHPSYWSAVEQLAIQYAQSTDKLMSIFDSAPSEAERKPLAQEKPSAKGPITRPGDPYTYGHNPNGEGYVVVSGPMGRGVGFVISPGTEAYDLVRAADPSAKPEEVVEPEVAPEVVPEPTPEVATSPEDVLPAEPEAAEPVAEEERTLAPGEVRVESVTPEKKRRVMEALKFNKSEDPEGAFAQWMKQPFTLARGPVTSRSGREVAIVDFGDNLPVDVRYDGISTVDGSSWSPSSLTKVERGDLDMRGREGKGLRQEMRRERKPADSREDPRSEKREENQRNRLRRNEESRNRRERARREARKIQLNNLVKKSKVRS